MKVTPILCPQCGCPPRNVLGVFQVRVGVSFNPKSGKLEKTGEKRVGKPVGGHALTLECGGRHQWEAQETA